MTRSPPHRAAFVPNALFGGWWGLMALLPIGHLTGVRNTWTIVVILATLLWVGRDAWQGLPARLTLVALLAWCALSIGWSTEPAVSFGKWRSDLLIPLLAYAAAFGFVRRTGSIAALAGGMVTGLVLLAIVSSFAFVGPDDLFGLRGAIRTESFPNIERPMPVWYPGVGDASMAASLAAGLLIFLRAAWSAATRWVLFLGWGALVLVVLVSNNRNAEIGIPLVVLACLWLARRRRQSTGAARSAKQAQAVRPPILAALLLALVVFVGMRLENGARERLDALRIPLAPGQSAFVQLTSRDTRPMIWEYYGRLALRSPWIGVGFGRTVPGLHYRTQDDRALASVEANAYSHAHNVFLNWWLQTGVVGVLLFVGAMVLVVRAALQASTRGTGPRAAGAAVVSIVVLMLIRDATDDFLVYGMATMFWTLLGGLAALRSHAAIAAPVSAPRGPS